MTVRSGRTFTGMTIPDTHPMTLPAAFVTRVHMLDVPASLRAHAAYALGELSGDEWWTVGEFRYEGEEYYDTAVARRVAGQIQYGIEKGE